MRTGSVVILLLLIAASCSKRSSPRPAPKKETVKPTAVGVARALAKELGERRFEAAVGRFGPQMARALSVKELRRQWDAMTGSLGAFKRVEVASRSVKGAIHTIHVDCVHARGTLPLRVVLDEQLRITGLRPRSRHGPKDFTRAARKIHALLVAGKWTEAVARFDDTMKKALPPEKLALVYQGVELDAGQHRRILAANVRSIPQGAVVDLECACAKKNANVRVTLDSRLRVAGLFFLPGWNPSGYADRRSFEEREVRLGTARLPLPGTLSLPKTGDGPFAAVVLVHGSGPNDRDETSGPNKIFKDLAWGLASRGVAVLRYEKRTKHYRGKLSNADIATVKEEILDDARTAVDLLSKTARVDPKRIVVAGHSLGATLAPRIARDDSRVRAVILLAGPTRSEGQIHLDQTRYLVGRSKMPTARKRKAIDEARERARRLDSPDLKPEEEVHGISGRYWIDLREHHGVKIAPTLSIPILVLQGARDYQVTLEDLRGWKRALAGREHVSFKVYPALNHHFMPGKGPSTPREYSTPNHVPRQVIDDIAGFVKKI